jgi:hypothetical protein
MTLKPYEYALQAINNSARAITDLAVNPDGTARDLPSDVTVGVLIAQSNLAIAAALMAIADRPQGGTE